VVVGVDLLGTEVVRLVLGHGDDPTALLAEHGWEVRRARDVTSHTVGMHVLTISFEVESRPASASDRRVGTRRDLDLVVSEGEVPEPHQRVAAYAFVTSSRGVLMTQFSDRTNAEGRWGLPGGGIDGGEAPELAVVRETWEETGQVIEVTDLAQIRTSHWIGRAPTGRLEDFHAVRVVYRAICPEPTDLDRLDITSSWRLLLSDVVVTPDEADGPDHREHDTDDDDRAWPQP
jgi:8-oxo-dGTP diphosphatase